MSRRAKGEGCIRLRKDGRWEGKYTAGCDLLTGKSIIKSVYAKTKKECAVKMAKAIQDNKTPYFKYGKGQDDCTVAEWCRVWFETYEKQTLRISTQEGYQNVIENHIIPFIGNIKLKRLNSVQIQTMYNHLKEDGKLNSHGEHLHEPLSGSSVQHIHMVLSSAMKQAVKERIIASNPCDNCKVPKRDKKEMKIIPPNKIGDYLEKSKEFGVYTMFCLELSSGLRKGELLALTWDDIDVESQMITVNKQLSRNKGQLLITEPKTANSIRRIAISDTLVKLLIDEHNKHQDNPVMFVCPRTNSYWSPDSIGRIHKKILRAADISDEIRFHDLRHTFATVAIQNGVDVKTVSSMLGHYSSAFTIDTYTHVTDQMQRGAAEKIAIFIKNDIHVNINVNSTRNEVITIE